MLISCEKIEVIKTAETIETKSFNVADSCLVIIEIQNCIENIELEINDYSIVGIENTQKGKFNPLLLKTNESYMLNPIKIIPQDLTLLLNGKIVYNSFVIYEGSIHIPIQNWFPENHIKSSLYNNCPWYDNDGNKILQSINFSVGVDGWKDENIEWNI